MPLQSEEKEGGLPVRIAYRRPPIAGPTKQLVRSLHKREYTVSFSGKQQILQSSIRIIRLL